MLPSGVALLLLAAPAASAQDAKPVMLGSGLLDAAISLSTIYDDNLFATRSDRRSDVLLLLEPSIGWRWREGNDRLQLGASLESARYDSNSDENYDDYQVSASGGMALLPSLEVFGSLRHAGEHEPRTSPDDAAGDEPTEYKDNSGVLGFAWRVDPIQLRLGASLQRLAFDDTSRLLGEINNDDRDRLMATFGGRLTYAATPVHSVFTQAFLDRRSYDQSRDDAGFQRDSHGFNLGAGYAFDLGPRLDGEVLAGIIHHSWDDPAFDQETALDVGGRLRWRSGEATSLVVNLSRSLQETTLAGSAAYLATVLSGTVERALSPSWSALARAGYYSNAYLDVGRDDYGWFTGIEGRYHLTPHTYLGLAYDYLSRDSSEPDEDYANNRVLLSLGATLQPYDAQGAGGADLPGVGYVLLGGTSTMLATAVAGPRGSGGTLTADFGDSGLGGLAVIGYGLPIDNWYVGVEAAVEGDTTDWRHARLPGGRVFSVERQRSGEAALRVGYDEPGHALAYGRAAAGRATFETNYDQGGGNVRSTSTRTGLGGGVGLELELGSSRFLRAEYDVTTYQDQVVLGDGFTSQTGQLRVGFGVKLGQWGPEPEVSEAIRAHDLSGFFVGALADHGLIHSDVAGARDAGSTLVADYADLGAGIGAFAGWGTVVGPAYLGFDLSVSDSDGRWEVERDPSGRVFSVARHEAVGGGLRLGAVIDERAIVFGRLGLTGSRIRTRYDTSGGATAQVTDRRLGRQYGPRVEVPLSERLFTRLDYTITRYDSYEVAYGNNTDRLDLDESTVRLGIGYRF